MPLYESSYLKKLSADKSPTMKTKLFSESSKVHTGFDIFLSHSYLDKDEVEGLYIELTNLGLTVYVDWIIDPHLDRKNVTKESAALIRQRMNSSKALLLAVSTNSEMSKWMPWEIGYVDGHTHQCAILPISKGILSVKTFKGFEYLQLYPYIKTADIHYRTQSYVVESSNRYVLFSDWLKKNNQPVYESQNIDLL